jgi:hypothetical protein
MSITLTVVSSGMGTCALTGKSDSDGLTVAFENEAPCFVSWRAFRQLLSFKTAQTGKPDAKPHGQHATPVPASSARPQ